MKPKIIKNKSLSSISTFSIGGKAEYFAEAKNQKEIQELIAWAKNKKIPCKICAGGSNVVFPDNVLKGLLIQIKNKKILKKSPLLIYSDAGVNLIKLVNYANRQGLEGLETLAGIPGTLGGAIYGNAGAYGWSISKSVKNVFVWDEEKQKTITNKKCGFGYRTSVFKKKDWVILGAELKLKKGNSKELTEKSRNIVAVRNKKYKPGIKCPGSFFKNVLVKNIPKKSLKLIDQSKIIDGKIPAGYILEKVGAKGMKRGGVKIANFHGNLLSNTGSGTAKDVKSLAQILKRKVKSKFGIDLEEEVRYF